VTLGHLFFTSADKIIAIILSFCVFASSFLIEPLGALFWGHLGDKYGSGMATKYSMLVMAIPTCFIGVLPNFARMGYLATFMLLILKLIQGFGAGGQATTNFCYIYEQVRNTKHATWFCGLSACGGWVGSLIASIVAYLLYTYFSDTTIQAWAWRLPFLITIPMFFVIYHFRKHITENKINRDIVKISDYCKAEFLSPFIKSFILLSFMQVSFYMLFVWLPTFLSNFLHISDRDSMLSNAIVLVVASISVAFWGYLGRFINYKKVILISVTLLLIFSYPLFASLAHASFGKLLLIQLAFVILYTPIEGSYIIAIGNAFKDKLRNRGFALSWNLSLALCGGTTPVICTYFTHSLNFNFFAIMGLLKTEI
jgi:MHS family proline/betaine transporter-like MFS transporter